MRLSDGQTDRYRQQELASNIIRCAQKNWKNAGRNWCNKCHSQL